MATSMFKMGSSSMFEAKVSMFKSLSRSKPASEVESIENTPFSCLSVQKDVELDYLEMDCRITVAVADSILKQMLSYDCCVTVELLEIADWLHMILTKSQATAGVIIVANIYIERLLEFNKLVNITNDNWKSVTLTAIILASKVWDDLSMVNVDFAYFMPFSLMQINEWERAFLRGLKYNVQVPQDLYEEQFNDLRSQAAHDETNFSDRYTAAKVLTCDQPQSRTQSIDSQVSPTSTIKSSASTVSASSPMSSFITA